MNYKEVAVRVLAAHGRFAVETRVGEVWHLVALRERSDAAQKIATDLRDLLTANTDDACEARSRAAAGDSVSPGTS